VADRKTDRSLKSLTLFEDFNEDHVAALGLDPVRPPSITLARRLVRMSKDLVKLSASFLVDASRLIDQFLTSETAFKLQSLSMTCNLLDSNAEKEKREALLELAAELPKRMPKLEVLELWYAKRGQACRFQFKRHQESRVVEIGCRGT
jgi:hypothetical protein